MNSRAIEEEEVANTGQGAGEAPRKEEKEEEGIGRGTGKKVSAALGISWGDDNVASFGGFIFYSVYRTTL